MSQITCVANWIQSSNNIVAFTGAGISTPSGIPDFRSENSGLWEGVNPLEVASLYGFRKNPAAFYDWIRPLTRHIIQAQPNAAHLALAELEKMQKLDAIITQNIDMLHSKAGNQHIYELHGHMRQATCIVCFKKYSGQDIIDYILQHDDVPRCTECGGIIKPDVILFAEQLPHDQLTGARIATKKADLMLAIGSSLEVAPACDLPLIAKRNGAKLVIINREPTAMDSFADTTLLGDAAIILPEILNEIHQQSV